MENFDRKTHWENIYESKALNEVSWYQPVPHTSLRLIREFQQDKSAAVLDAGGGDSFLADHLLKAGFSDVSVLDISANAIQRAKERLAENAPKIKWIVSDVLEFSPAQNYDCWHDRAVFHFLTEEQDIRSYVRLVSGSIRPGGTLIIGTFSEQGPLKCSGIPIRQYNEDLLEATFAAHFEKISCETEEHPTPFNTLQSFIFCTFRRKAL